MTATPAALHEVKTPAPPPVRDSLIPESTAPAVRSPIDIRSAALTIIAVLGVVVVLQYAQPVVIPIVLGVLISYALDPLVSWLERFRVPRGISAALLLLAMVVGGGALVYGLRSETV